VTTGLDPTDGGGEDARRAAGVGGGQGAEQRHVVGAEVSGRLVGVGRAADEAQEPGVVDVPLRRALHADGAPEPDREQAGAQGRLVGEAGGQVGREREGADELGQARGRVAHSAASVAGAARSDKPAGRRVRPRPPRPEHPLSDR
jgi:hypothetical protein